MAIRMPGDGSCGIHLPPDQPGLSKAFPQIPPGYIDEAGGRQRRAAEHGGQQEAGGAGGQRLPSFQFYGKLSTLQGLSTSRSFFLIVAERRQKARRKSAAG